MTLAAEYSKPNFSASWLGGLPIHYFIVHEGLSKRANLDTGSVVDSKGSLGMW